MSTVGFEGFMQATLCVGMAPFTSVIELIIQVNSSIAAAMILYGKSCIIVGKYFDTGRIHGNH